MKTQSRLGVFNTMKYTITLNGLGSETYFVNLTNEQADWFLAAEAQDFPVTAYFDDPSEFEDMIPQDVNFLSGVDGEYYDWKHEDISYCNFYSPCLDDCELLIEDENGLIILRNQIASYLGNSDLFEWDEDVSIVGKEDVRCLRISENFRGNIFCGMFEHESFDVSKLKIRVCEGPDGDDFITKLFYNNEEIINTHSKIFFKGLSYSID